MEFNKVLIANRGEIAVRVIRACHQMGLDTVAIYSDADCDALHVTMADEAFNIGTSEARASYLDGTKIISTAIRAGADAIHPGYGFLAENAGFARACIEAGLTFVGPSADFIAQMGSKIAAKCAAEQAGVPVVPGYHGEDRSYSLAQLPNARSNTSMWQTGFLVPISSPLQCCILSIISKFLSPGPNPTLSILAFRMR